MVKLIDKTIVINGKIHKKRESDFSRYRARISPTSPGLVSPAVTDKTCEINGVRFIHTSQG
jgi:hypothetical protein